jgi:hypothetical protein
MFFLESRERASGIHLACEEARFASMFYLYNLVADFSFKTVG